MTPFHHPRCNGTYGPPRRWNAKQRPPVAAIPVLQTTVDGIPAVISFWRPSPAELLQLQRGGVVSLCVLSPIQPVVRVGAEPDGMRQE